MVLAGTDRRESIKLAIGAALLPILAARPAVAQLAARPSPATISPPAGTMIYRRTLERALRGGTESVVIQRDFAVQFDPAASGGFVVSGEQTAVIVHAPPSLAQLAAIEERRVESGLFPLQLDQCGRITGWSAPGPRDHLTEALQVVRDSYAASGADLGGLIEALHGASAELVTRVPDDLFAPEESLREEHRAIELPWGDHGEVLTQFEAERDPQTRLMRHAQRVVTTRYGGEERRNRESWALFAA